MVTKVIRADAAKKYKKSIAISFVKNRLTELRSEEQRRVSCLLSTNCDNTRNDNTSCSINCHGDHGDKTELQGVFKI